MATRILLAVGIIGFGGMLVAANVPGARLADGKLWIGNGSNVAAPVTPSGDVTITNAGVTAIGSGKVTSDDIAANVVVTADVDQNFLQVANVQLTNAQMVALRATPITLVAAVADVAIVVHRVGLFFDWTANYTESNDNLAVEYASGTDITVIEGTGLVDAGADAARLIGVPDGQLVELTGANTACDTTCGGACLFGFDDGAADAEVTVVCSGATADRCMCYRPLVPVVNSAVRILNNGDGEFGGGNAANTVSVRVWYSRLPMAAFSSGG